MRIMIHGMIFTVAVSAVMLAVWLLTGSAMPLGSDSSDSAASVAVKHSHVLAATRSRLIDRMFPRLIAIGGYTYSYTGRDRTPTLNAPTQIREYHSRSINLDRVAREEIALHEAPLDSYWEYVLHSGTSEQQARFHTTVREVEALVDDLLGMESKFSSTLEKAVFHRDVVTMCQVANSAIRREPPGSMKELMNAFRNKLIRLLANVSLSNEEFLELRRFVTQSWLQQRFADQCTFDLQQNYLPRIVWGDQVGWYEFPSDESSRMHFDIYGGRCFIRAYLKVPGFSQEDYYRYSIEVTGRFGFQTTRTGGLPPLAPGTQTVLIRTFGVFLNDGSYADTTIPEEVIARIFKTSKPELDMTTSDFLGTLFYQYKLRRDSLLGRPGTLGLERVLETDGQFFGFLSEIPEHHSTSNSDVYTTMRANCIACHSEQLYGPSTIFSLGRHKPVTRGSKVFEGGKLEPVSAIGWRVNNDDVGDIQKRLMAIAKP